MLAIEQGRFTRIGAAYTVRVRLLSWFVYTQSCNTAALANLGPSTACTWLCSIASPLNRVCVCVCVYTGPAKKRHC